MVVAAAMLLAACADVAGGPTPERPAGTPTSPAHGAPGSASAPSAPAGPVPTEPEERTAMITPGLQRIVDLAVANLTARTGVPAGDITVVAAETTTWPDAALGCPQPGRRYAQVPYDGAWVHLRAGGREYRYHTGGQVTEPFLCEQSTTQRDPGAPGEPMPDRRDPRLRSPGER